MSKDQNSSKKQNVETVDKCYYCRLNTYKETKNFKCKSKTKKAAITEGINYFKLNNKNIEIVTSTWIKDGLKIKNIWFREIK